ncbi:MAG: hypothetical protein OIN87_06995 [Candidatus Methanoperedens sp.]|nr:hypothetical protein [Candidatus Methanoperedens sp.]
MDLDFTFNKYGKLCQTIANSGYSECTVKSYFSESHNHVIILRHDVDRIPGRALEMARMENEYGLLSTYYFRTIDEVFKPDIIRKIANLGHEIGYHYEVLDKMNGNHEAAIKLFEKELEKLREIAPIVTACMHGNPLKSWSNKDIWNYYDFTQYNIIGEPYISIDYNKVKYFTDTGRSWNNTKYSVKDKTNFNQLRLENSDKLIQLIKNETYPEICILTHPNRWSETRIQWIKEFIFQNIKNIIKIGINTYK